MPVKLKRVYEPPEPSDGVRILVDRLWPRGLSREEARIDVWLKKIAPSDQLRQWYHRDRSRWGEFRRRYLAELVTCREELRQLAGRCRKERITLLFSSRDSKRNNAVVLKQYLSMLTAGEPLQDGMD